jgi:hypothetical protein
VFLFDHKLKVNIYLKIADHVDYQNFIEELNKELPKYERISFFEVFIDTLDTRLKQ